MAVKATVATDENVDGTIDALAAIYEFRDEPAVRAFLANNADLFPVLSEIPDRISAYLPPTDQRPALEVFEDPENEAAPPQLVVYVPTHLRPPKARQSLNRFSRDWWLDAFRRAGLRLHVDIEYR
jgi:hypothetical protein